MIFGSYSSTHEQTSQQKKSSSEKGEMAFSHKGIGWPITTYTRNHILDIKAHIIDVFASKGQRGRLRNNQSPFHLVG